MGQFLRIDRRGFLRGSTGMLGGAGLLNRTCRGATAGAPVNIAEARGSHLKMQTKLTPAGTVWILVEPGAGFKEQFAARELARGLRNLGLAREPIQASPGEGEPGARDFVFSFIVNREQFQHPEAYEITQEGPPDKTPRVRLTGATPQAALYAVFDFLERQGAFFGLDGEVYPPEPQRTLSLPSANEAWRGMPRFSVRGLVPWPDFLNCVTVYNREDWRAYLEAMVRMRFNTLGIHAYPAESFLSFEYAGAGHIAYTDTTATSRCGCVPERTSRYGMGGADFFADEVFGSEATTLARNTFEAQEMAQKLWAEAFQYAKQLGIRTGVGFEPYNVPDEILRATPPEARRSEKDTTPGARINPESSTARDILEARLGSLLEAYPMLDDVWLWEDEGMSWESQRTKVPLSVTPFKQAYGFLKRHAPDKRLVISGWGGVVRHFPEFHQTLPEDIVFSSLSDNLGWDPVNENYGKLAGRERWPIPWLEDDPAMWLPQFHVARFVRDMDLAEQYGCQGVLGIHWRHRIMDVDAGFQADNSWNKGVTPTQFFQHFASAQAREPRASALAKTLEDMDRDRLLLCTWTGEVKNGHSVIQEYSGDYDEGFQFWGTNEPSDSVKKSQAEVARQLRVLTEAASGPAERERLNYLARFVGFLVPYTDSWSLAQRLHLKLQQAQDLNNQNKKDDARRLIASEGVPLWLQLAPKVREVFLNYQEIVSTRNDQGQLASMHNKYERLALYRLPASMKEFLGELPPEVERSFAESRQPDANVLPRAFVPTRPTVLRKGERVRITAVAPGTGRVARVTLHTRTKDSQNWVASPMSLLQRRTYSSDLEWRQGTPLADYYIAAEIEQGGAKTIVTCPPEAPNRYHTLTLI